MDCFYDKKYNSDPLIDKENARAVDSTTPTYNVILLQNVKTTDVCAGNAIFLIGRPASHMQKRDTRQCADFSKERNRYPLCG